MSTVELCGTVPSPLELYLEGMPVRKLRELRWVKLSPALGYNDSIRFNSAAMMLQYLKPDNVLVDGNVPSYRARIKSFNRPITNEIFEKEGVLA